MEEGLKEMCMLRMILVLVLNSFLGGWRCYYVRNGIWKKSKFGKRNMNLGFNMLRFRCL